MDNDQQHTAHRRIRVPKECLSTSIDGTTVLLTPRLDYVELDEVGSSIWRAIVTYGDLEQIVESMLTEYEVSRETLLADVRSYVDELAGLGAVVMASE